MLSLKTTLKLIFAIIIVAVIATSIFQIYKYVNAGYIEAEKQKNARGQEHQTIIDKEKQQSNVAAKQSANATSASQNANQQTQFEENKDYSNMNNAEIQNELIKAANKSLLQKETKKGKLGKIS